MGETTGGALRRGSDRIVGGVCSGLAAYFRVDAVLVRIAFVVLTLIPPGVGVGVILYLVLWFLMEPPQGAPTSATRNIGARLQAMGDELREDLRTGFRTHAGGETTPPPTGSPAASPPPAGAPQPPTSSRRWWEPGQGDRRGGLWLGIILVAIGAYTLIDNLGYFRAVRWELVWPVVLIAIGLLLLVRRR